MATELPQGFGVPKRDPEVIDQCLRKLTEKGQRLLQICANQLKRMRELNVLNEDGSELLESIPTYVFGGSGSGAKATIAFVGETGEGKSTLLNALLGCGGIAPTSGSSACTCVATEFGGRTSDMHSKFYAIVEYISREDFEQEVQALRQEIQDKGGTIDYDEDNDLDTTMESSDTRSQYTTDGSSLQSYDAAIDKLKALFPGFQERDLSGISEKVRALYETEPLKSGKRVIESNNDSEFVDEVFKVVSAKNGSSGNEPELWPLVKVVKIYLDSDVLRTGAVLVDLPGIQDSNAARTGVANEYLEKADRVIIVSRLSRALDRKPTANLAKAHFERQIQSAGRKRITLVCTWCDSFKPSDAKTDFKDVPGFLKKFAELSRGTEKLSNHALRALSPKERNDYRIGVEMAKKQLNDFCRQTLDEEMPKRLSEKYCEVVKENVDVKSFLVASTRYQELADMGAGDDDDEAYETQIPQLKNYCMRIPVEQRAYKAASFISSDVVRIYSDLGLFLTSIGTSLNPETLNAIKIELKEAGTDLKKDLIELRNVAIQATGVDIDGMIDQVGEFARNAKTDSANVLQRFRKKYKSPVTFLALCRRNGTWKIGSEPGKDLNDRLLDGLADNIHGEWKSTILNIEQKLDSFKIDSVRRLGGFQVQWEEVTRRYKLNLNNADYEATKKHFVAALDCLSRQVSNNFRADIVKKAKRKGRVLNAVMLSETVESSLEGCYAEAAKIRGKKAYDRMINTFLSGLEDNDPFKNMGYEMCSHLQDLKNELSEATRFWCERFENHLEKTVQAWTKKSKESGQLEVKEKAKLREILSQFEDYKVRLVGEAKRLELEAQT
ncbi:hypothetical protein TWF679_000400 [Orbilia oligospora]|uniref:Dynamin N-terminal domain-containing protein n=1 Tax=Orbilia oligospora TaxID=2813651 RepID=A0A8H8VI55_ORBOL|nr:hypothetical protein TWF679_000400 [Orbilia oligospora]